MEVDPPATEGGRTGTAAAGTGAGSEAHTQHSPLSIVSVGKTHRYPWIQREQEADP